MGNVSVPEMELAFLCKYQGTELKMWAALGTPYIAYMIKLNCNDYVHACLSLEDNHAEKDAGLEMGYLLF